MIAGYRTRFGLRSATASTRWKKRRGDAARVSTEHLKRVAETPPPPPRRPVGLVRAAPLTRGSPDSRRECRQGACHADLRLVLDEPLLLERACRRTQAPPPSQRRRRQDPRSPIARALAGVQPAFAFLPGESSSAPES